MPSRDDILRFVAEQPGKVGKREIARAFNVKGGDRITLKALLSAMADEGLIQKSGKRLKRPGELPPVTLLKVVSLTGGGEPIAEPANWDGGEPPRVTIVGRGPAPGIGDRILARISSDDDGRHTGKVIKVIERRPVSHLAVVEEQFGRKVLSPVSKREREPFPIDPRALKAVDPGTLVRIEAERGRGASIAEILGPVTSEKAVSMIAIHAHDIPHVFPQAVLAEAEAAAPAALAGREDWRDVPLVTIDPADAKDHDDAVFAETDPANEGGHIVTVAIADVAHYVTQDSAMDAEALNRGNSTYFPDRVVPMLPERLSNGLCSLKEGQERAAIAVRMVFARDGRKTRHSFHRVLMRSARSLAYGEAQAIADGADSDITGLVSALWDAYACLKRGREVREPLELDLPERKVILNEDGAVQRIVVPERLDAHRLIEEFMIQANVAAAETAEAKGIPLLYRIHDAPALDKLEALREFLATLDIRLARGTRVRPSHFNGILARVAETPNETLVNEVVLRTQAQAEYAPDNLGHFGLNLRRYAHFTSPIRRYADLIVHRALIRAEGLGPDGLTDEEIAELPQIGQAISASERRSMVAERDTIDRLVAAWLADRVGSVFPGRIGGVTKAGLFIKLDGSGADGFVPISTLGAEYMVFDEAARSLIGETTGAVYRLGDAVEVRLLEAAPVSGGLRFEIVDHDPSVPRAKRRPVRRARPAPRRGPVRRGRR